MHNNKGDVMKEKIIDLKYGKLHLIKTKKFRSINIKILLKDIIKKEDITKRNFLTDYLVNSTKKYNSRKKLALKVQDLYSLHLSSFNTRVGNYLITRFNLSLLNPKYTEKSMLESSIDLFHEVIFEPNVKNNKFESSNFKIIKNNIESEIKTVKENTRLYASVRLLENIDNKPYSYRSFGYLEDLENINEKNLYDYYKEFLNKCDVDIYVMGEFDEKEMVSLIKEKLNFKTIKKPKSDLTIYHDTFKKNPNIIIENTTNNQSKLAIGCKTKDLTEFERKYVISIYNMIVGGGFNSKFMQIIREKKSLAYYINSNIIKADNLFLIQSGISHKNFEEVVKNIKEIMKNISKHSVTKQELDDAKMEYLSILDESMDNMDNYIENIVATDLLDLDDMDTRRKEIEKVTIEDIENVSKKIIFDTIYLLRGDDNEKK